MRERIKIILAKKNRRRLLAVLMLMIVGLSILPSQNVFAAGIKNARETMKKKVLVSVMNDCAQYLPSTAREGSNPFGVISSGYVNAPLWLIKEAGELNVNRGGKVSCKKALDVVAGPGYANKSIKDILFYNCDNRFVQGAYAIANTCNVNKNVDWGRLLNVSLPISTGEWYLSDLDSFTGACGATIAKDGSTSGKTKTRTTSFPSDTKAEIIDAAGAEYNVNSVANIGGNNTCETYAANLKNADNVNAWETFLAQNGISFEEVSSAQAYEAAHGGGDGENGEKEKTCMNSGGAKSLGWIVCPALDWAGDAVKELYDKFVKPALTVNPRLFADESGNTTGMFNGWNSFRNIANVFFIILLLGVIFSQLTGVGIDNYGIKKVLPKMIVAAVMINLSYWLCVALVDVANIVGNSFQGLFDGLANALNNVTYGVEGMEPQQIETGGIVSAVVLSGVVTGGVAAFSNPAILLSLLVSAIGVIISILFLFVLLSAREAAIVVLTVISPLAVACYMLPNTKTLFDKWWKFFKGLLLVYPIAGLLVGGGNYVSKLLLSVGDNSTFGTLTAMIAGIVPVFFIPTVLKNAFAAMGNIGGKLAGLGQTASKGVQKKARDSQAYKDMQERGRERKTRLMAGVDKNGKDKNVSRLGQLVRGGKRNMNRNRGQFLQDLEKRNRENQLGTVEGFFAARAGIDSKQRQRELDDTSAMLEAGHYINENGAMQDVDPNDMNALAELVKTHKNSTLGKVAASKMAKSGGPGQDQLQKTMEEMIEDAKTSEQQDAVRELGAYLGQYNRGDISDKSPGLEEMVNDLSAPDNENGTKFQDIKQAAKNGGYDLRNARKMDSDKYMKMTSQAKERLANNVSTANREQAHALHEFSKNMKELHDSGKIKLSQDDLERINKINTDSETRLTRLKKQDENYRSMNPPHDTVR